MSNKNLFLAPFIALILATPLPSIAAILYSVASLTHICGSNDDQARSACKFYLHGVVESWMVKDLVGVDPMSYQSQGNSPVFCETINKVSDDEWLKIVRNDLSSMNAGFASSAVMESLANKLCK